MGGTIARSKSKTICSTVNQISGRENNARAGNKQEPPGDGWRSGCHVNGCLEQGNSCADPGIAVEVGSAIIRIPLTDANDRMNRLSDENDRLQRDTEALQIYLNEYRDIIDHLNIGIVLINPWMEVLNANQRILQWYPDLEIKQKPLCYRAFSDPPREEPCSACPMILTLHDGQIHEAVMSHQECTGHTKSYRLITSPVFDGMGKMIGGVNIMRDITEQVQMQKVIQESKSLYRTIFELSETPAAVIREEGTLIIVNHEFEKKTGYSRGELEGHQNWEKLFAPEDFIHVENFRRKRMDDFSRTFKTYETRLRGRDKTARNVLMNMLRIPETTLVLISFTDITERRTGTAAVMQS